MTYRNRALLDLCHEAPCLLLPGQHECTGDSEPCHSDMLRHGRGEKHKSHDCFAPPGCHNAHLAFTRSNLGKEGYFQAWVEAMERYWLWLWVAGKIRLTDITQRAKDTAMEAPHCKICEHNHWARDPHILPADAPVEKRSKVHTERVAALLLPQNSKAFKTIEPTPAPNNDNLDARTLGESLSPGSICQPVVRGGKARTTGSCRESQTAGTASIATNPQRTAGGGLTARRDGKNTSREGRDVVKPKGTSSERDHLKAQPATANPGKTAGAKGTAEKPPLGKRKTAPKATKAKERKK